MTVCFWSTETGNQVLSPLTGHTDCKLSISFSPDGLDLAS